MDKSVIVIDVLDDELFAYDEDDITNRRYSDIEKRALLQELPYFFYDSMSIDHETNEISCVYGTEVIKFRNIEKLREFSEFKVVNAHLEKERNRLVSEKQVEKLKSRKNKKVSRFALFGMAALLSFPSSINYDVATKYVQYSNVSFVDIKDSEYSIDNLDSNVLQGVCVVGNYTFLSAYDSSLDKDNSTIYILNKDNECIREVTLYNNSHVGGICYDQEHRIFWITDKGGTISGYSFNSIFYSQEDIIEPIFKKIDVGSEDLINYKGYSSAGYITYHNGKVFVGNYSIDGTGILKSFDILEDGSIDKKSENRIKFLDKVQGISFYEKNGKDYLLVSSSYGKFFNSELKVFKYYEDCKDYSNLPSIQVTMPPMMEQITFNKNGKLVTLYESNALKYQTMINAKNSDVVVTDIGTVVENNHFKVL